MTSWSRGLYSELSSVVQYQTSERTGLAVPDRVPRVRAMSARCRRMGAVIVGVEWGGKLTKPWPVLRSSQDVAREGVGDDLAEAESQAKGSDARGDARTRTVREEDK